MQPWPENTSLLICVLERATGGGR